MTTPTKKADLILVGISPIRPVLDLDSLAFYADSPTVEDRLYDLAAILAFLNEYKESPNTLRNYARECERLLLWARDQDKTLADLGRDDFDRYLAFLASPAPADRWCGPKRRRDSAEWRPFVGPLSPAAISTALASIGSMMDYLVSTGHLPANPLALMRMKHKKMLSGRPAPLTVERFIDPQMWNAVLEALEAIPRSTIKGQAHYERMRFILSMLYLLGPRASELEHGVMGDFREQRGRWWWYVLGKGGKYARVAVPDDMVAALARYRKYLGLSAAPSPDDHTPLLLALNRSSMTARRMNQLLKKIFWSAAVILEPGSAIKADKLRKASAHWGRHTAITAKVDAGMDPRYVQKDARHSDPRTTALYTHEEDDKRHDDAQKVRINMSIRGK
uniref:Phage integrase n=1 Tax=mine drainage metagenome TaxID=410659 RepID=E6QLT7_9ZZZZ